MPENKELILEQESAEGALEYKSGILTYKDTRYKLKYGLKRIEMIENTLGKSMVSIMQSGSMTITELTVTFAYGLIREDSYVFEPTKKAKEMAEELLEAESGAYQKISDMIADALERDCPFFFPKG